MSKLESFTYSCLPALLILVFSEVAVYLADGKALTMGLLGLLYLILVWWLYQFTRGKIMLCQNDPVEEEAVDVPVEEEQTI